MKHDQESPELYHKISRLCAVHTIYASLINEYPIDHVKIDTFNSLFAKEYKQLRDAPGKHFNMLDRYVLPDHVITPELEMAEPMEREEREKAMREIVESLINTDFSKAREALDKPQLRGWFVGKTINAMHEQKLSHALYSHVERVVYAVFEERADWIRGKEQTT